METVFLFFLIIDNNGKCISTNTILEIEMLLINIGVKSCTMIVPTL